MTDTDVRFQTLPKPNVWSNNRASVELLCTIKATPEKQYSICISSNFLCLVLALKSITINCLFMINQCKIALKCPLKCENMLPGALSNTAWHFYRFLLVHNAVNESCRSKSIPQQAISWAIGFSDISQADWIGFLKSLLLSIMQNRSEAKVVYLMSCRLTGLYGGSLRLAFEHAVLWRGCFLLCCSQIKLT